MLQADGKIASFRGGRLMHIKRFTGLLVMLLTGLLAACDFGGQSSSNGPTAQITLPNYMRQGYETYHETGGVGHPANAIDVFIVYAPETQQYMPHIIQQFNTISASGKNPVTGQPWANGERPIFVAGQQPVSGSSGSVSQGIINAIIAPN